MQIESPYGKDILLELKTIYGFDSVEAAVNFIVRHVQQHYQIQKVSIEALYIGFGLVAKLKTEGEIYYLKFASRTMHSQPEQLFPWLDYARSHGIPLPKIIPANDGSWYLSPLDLSRLVSSDYDVVYLMREVPGKPMHQANALQLHQYAETMAHFHRLGMEYPYPVLGSNATWQAKWQERHELWDNLKDNTIIAQDLVAKAMDLIEKTGTQKLPKTIVHGDLRLCHVFFQDNSLSGIIDADQSTQGEKFIDFCYGLVSGFAPESGSILEFDELRNTLSIYHQSLPLNVVEKLILKATFAYAILETLIDVANFVVAGKSTTQDIVSTQKLLQVILDTSDRELLVS